jgi:hypothetical protein
MPDQWLFKSATYDNCNCAVNCGCQFNLPSTHGYCQSAFVGNILPISLESNWELRTAKVEIPGVMHSQGQPIINEFSGEPFHVALARPSGSFEFTYAEIGQGSTSISGDMEMSFTDSWAHYCIHHFNQDGLVRARPRLTRWLDA